MTVEIYAFKESPWKDLKAGIFLGPASFVDDIKDFIKGASPEVPKRQRQPARPELTTVIPQPNEAADEHLLLARRHNYTLQEIADYLSIHYATVSRRVKRSRDREGKG